MKEEAVFLLAQQPVRKVPVSIQQSLMYGEIHNQAAPVRDVRDMVNQLIDDIEDLDLVSCDGLLQSSFDSGALLSFDLRVST